MDCHQSEEDTSLFKSVHPPFGDGECDSCHDDHGDENNLVLSDDGNTLCENCHDFSDSTLAEAHRGIPGSKASCRGCHNPHQSRQSSLLRAGLHEPVKEGKCNACHRKSGKLLVPKAGLLCLACHPRKTFTGHSTHKPVEKGNCLVCHDPHGSPERALLLGRYSGDRWLTDAEKDIPLCFQCHNAAHFSSDGSASDTSFRNGQENLHRLHVFGPDDDNVQKGRSKPINCRNCHDAHASSDEHLIRQELDCGGVLCLKLNYQVIPGGGECRTGCHGMQSYTTVSDEQGVPAFVEPGLSASPSQPEGETGEANCGSCHDQVKLYFNRPNIHLPIKMGDCGVCHLDHGEKNMLLLTDSEENLCKQCHDMKRPAAVSSHYGYSLDGSRCSECHDPHSSGGDYLSKSFEHAPYEERNCLSCHNEAVEGWKVESPNEVCGNCHEKDDYEAHVRGAIAEGLCTDCHNPHVSNVNGLLRKEVPSLCFTCHDRREFSRENIHSPVAEGDCGSCHPHHSTGSEHLLSGDYPSERYTSFKLEDYGLCWKCHDSLKLFSTLSAEETGFRNTKTNLHVLHVWDRKKTRGGEERSIPGTSCRNCHAPHSTDNPNLIRKTLDCDGVLCLELEFKKMGFTGTCLKGCHKSSTYSP